MADVKSDDRKGRPDRLGGRSNRDVRSKKDFFGSTNNGLEKACSYLIEKGHLSVWDYGWSFFETALKTVRETIENERELQMQLHGCKLKK